MEGLNQIIPNLLNKIVARAGYVVQRYGDDLTFPQIRPNNPQRITKNHVVHTLNTSNRLKHLMAKSTNKVT